MAESEFSWLKVASFVGALILIIVCMVMLGLGINMISGGNAFQGGACVVAGLLSGGLAVWVYKNYQKKGSH